MTLASRRIAPASCAAPKSSTFSRPASSAAAYSAGVGTKVPARRWVRVLASASTAARMNAAKRSHGSAEGARADPAAAMYRRRPSAHSARSRSSLLA